MKDGLDAGDRAEKTLKLVKKTEEVTPEVRKKVLPGAAGVITAYTDVIMGSINMVATFKHWQEYTDTEAEKQIQEAMDQLHTGLMALNTALDYVDEAIDEVTK